MNDNSPDKVTAASTVQRARARLFRAYVSRFEAEDDREAIDELAKWVEVEFAPDLQKRPSKHVYIRTLPAAIVQQIDRLRDSPLIRDAIIRQSAANSVIVPMKHTDELYISHYNRDYGGDHGLFTKHYDGNLRFLWFSSVVRALIYLQSDASYKVVFSDSGVEKAFETYDFGLLDFHRELHWVEGEYNPSGESRILLKCNYLICPRSASLSKRAVLAVNTGVFYTVKAAMEYSKSPKTPPQFAVGFLCNLMRWMNNIHPFVPMSFILLLFSVLVWAAFRLVA